MSKLRFSVFDDCPVSVTRKDGTPVPPEEAAKFPSVQIEFVYRRGDDPEEAVPVACFMIINGQRIAKRKAGQWVSIIRGLPVINEEPAPHWTLQ
jgi:hypothetical protein